MLKFSVIVVAMLIASLACCSGATKTPFSPARRSIHLVEILHPAEWATRFEIDVLHDDTRGVTCYVFRTNISCIPDYQLRAPIDK